MSSISAPLVSVFFSYAGADDEAFGGWIELFRKRLQPALKGRLRNAVHLDEVHSYLSNGAIAGELDRELNSRIAGSAAMVVFVHANYLDSEACRRELEIFCGTFGAEGLDDRLFIVAMSQEAIEKLFKSEHWGRIFGTRQQVWIDFINPDSNGKPLPIYLETNDRTMIVSAKFQNQLDRLLDGMVCCLKQPLKRLPPPLQKNRRWLIGACVRELIDEVRRLGQALQQQAGCEVEFLSPDTLVNGDFSEFDRADDLVLPFNDASCAHLDLQQRAWEGAGKPRDRIHWLDLRRIKPEKPATPTQLETLRKLVNLPVTFEQLLGVDNGLADGNQAVIYIESNKRELDHFESLGKRLRPYWESIATGSMPPQLAFRHRGLAIDKLADLPTLAEADGFILLWGLKDPESLLAQISQVEKRVQADPDLPPGIVAYLIPPHDGVGGAVPAYGWRVLRFDASSVDNIDVILDESERLKVFLRQVYERVIRRRGSLPAST